MTSFDLSSFATGWHNTFLIYKTLLWRLNRAFQATFENTEMGKKQNVSFAVIYFFFHSSFHEPYFRLDNRLQHRKQPSSLVNMLQLLFFHKQSKTTSLNLIISTLNKLN